MQYNIIKMGVTKSDLFTEKQNQMAVFAKVLAHPARVAILQEVLKSKSCVNTLLVQELGLAQATISQHLRELKTADILCGSVEGKSISYCINPETWKIMQLQFAQLFGQFSSAECETNNNNCCD